GDHVLARDLVHLFRARFLWESTWHERIRLWNYSHSPVHVSLVFEVGADFADIFEVRGTRRARSGTHLEPVVNGRTLRLEYVGLDRERRWTTIEWGEAPAAATGTMARFDYELAPQTPVSLSVQIRCERERRLVAVRSFEKAESEAAAALERARADYAIVESSSE